MRQHDPALNLEVVAIKVFRIVFMVDFSTIINKKVILTCSSHYFFKFTKKNLSHIRLSSSSQSANLDTVAKLQSILYEVQKVVAD